MNIFFPNAVFTGLNESCLVLSLRGHQKPALFAVHGEGRLTYMVFNAGGRGVSTNGSGLENKKEIK